MFLYSIVGGTVQLHRVIPSEYIEKLIQKVDNNIEKEENTDNIEEEETEIEIIIHPKGGENIRYKA